MLIDPTPSCHASNHPTPPPTHLISDLHRISRCHRPLYHALGVQIPPRLVSPSNGLSHTPTHPSTHHALRIRPRFRNVRPASPRHSRHSRAPSSQDPQPQQSKRRTSSLAHTLTPATTVYEFSTAPFRSRRRRRRRRRRAAPQTPIHLNHTCNLQ